MPFHPPPVWSLAELEIDRQKAIGNFVTLRRKESQTLYGNAWLRARTWVEDVFRRTQDLTNLDRDVFLPDDPTPSGTDANGKMRLAAYRFLAGVPVSADDLRTMVGDPLGRRVMPAVVRQRAIDAVQPEIDRIRVPWIDEGRAPTPAERERAIDWTAGLMATEQRRTARRSRASNLQETCVSKVLRHAGFRAGDGAAIGEIHLASSLPVGHFLRETRVAGAKCDVPVRLRDGRLLTVECKSSNRASSSHQRCLRHADAVGRTGQGGCALLAAPLGSAYPVPRRGDLTSPSCYRVPNAVRGLVSRFVFPDTKNEPTMVCQELISFPVARPGSFELGAPPTGVALRNAPVLRAGVPETSIDEYRHPIPTKDQVSRTPEPLDWSRVHTVAQPARVHLSSYR
jgi:hypothetical protein